MICLNSQIVWHCCLTSAVSICCVEISVPESGIYGMGNQLHFRHDTVYLMLGLHPIATNFVPIYELKNSEFLELMGSL